MKNLIPFLSLSFLILFTACQPEEITPDLIDELSNLTAGDFSPCMDHMDVEVDSLPHEVTDTLMALYGISDIEEIEIYGENLNQDFPSNLEFVGVELSDETTILLDVEGNIIYEGLANEETEITPDDLPQEVTDYFNLNHPNDTIEEAAQILLYGFNYYTIELTNDAELFFDGDGAFVCQTNDDDDDNDNDNDDDDNDEDDDDEDDDDEDDDDEDDDDEDDDDYEITDALTNQILANFPGFEIKDAELELLCDDTEVIIVEISDGTTELELIFDLDENMLYSATEIEISDLPQAVSDAINQTYPGAELDDAKQLELSNGTLQYEVEIETTDTEWLVIFSSEGDVICQKAE